MATVLPKNIRNPRSDVVALVPDDRKLRREFTPGMAADKLIILFSRVDLDCEWCLTRITAEDHRCLLDRIRSIESMTLFQVFSNDGKIGKDYEIPTLPNARARRRLEELEYDDRDKISRLQITGERRLYGFRAGARFYALWWDPHHRIWPSKKK
ncbi:hypothetical protein [Amycolatopsis pigmentata]